MKSGGLLVLVAAVGVYAGTSVATADLPTPTVPSITVPTVTVPTIPFPPPPTTPPPVPTISTPVQVPSLPPSGSSAGSAASRGAGSSGSSTRSSGASPARQRPARVARLRASRPWLTQHGRHRSTTLIFRLARASRVTFTVVQVSPACYVAGSFSVRGHAGVNRVRFAGRVQGRQLAPGTYRIHAGAAQRITVVIVPTGRPSSSELAAARRRNVCASRGVLAANVVTGTRSSGAKPGEIVRHQNPGAVVTRSPRTKTHASALSPSVLAKHVTNPFVIAALALAVFLFGLAAVPQRAVPDPRLTDLLARHRLEVAAAGIAALGAGLIALALG